MHGPLTDDDRRAEMHAAIARMQAYMRTLPDTGTVDEWLEEERLAEARRDVVLSSAGAMQTAIVRFTREEWDEVYAAARARGVTVSEFASAAALAATRAGKGG